MSSFPILLSLARPGTLIAVPQVPLTSVTTNAWSWKDRSVYAPPALQKPAELQDIVKVLENLPWFSAPRPGTGMALPHVPPVSLATHACSLPVGSTDSPPAAQLPAEAHDIEPTSASPCGARPRCQAPEWRCPRCRSSRRRRRPDYSRLCPGSWRRERNSVQQRRSCPLIRTTARRPLRPRPG